MSRRSISGRAVGLFSLLPDPFRPGGAGSGGGHPGHAGLDLPVRQPGAGRTGLAVGFGHAQRRPLRRGASRAAGPARPPATPPDPALWPAADFDALVAAFRAQGFRSANAWYLNDAANVAYASSAPDEGRREQP